MKTKVYTILKLETNSYSYPIRIRIDDFNSIYIVEDVDCLFFLGNDVLYENYREAFAGEYPSRLEYKK